MLNGFISNLRMTGYTKRRKARDLVTVAIIIAIIAFTLSADLTSTMKIIVSVLSIPACVLIEWTIEFLYYLSKRSGPHNQAYDEYNDIGFDD